jgi:cytochrome c biogenesis protein CcmG, thiol:disulfide interchange protein DsbE
VTCPECGAKMEPRARFCHHCGWDSKLAAAGKASSGAGHRPLWKRWTMSVFLGLGTIAVLLLLLIPHSDATTSLIAGQAAPAFDEPALAGGRVKLSDLKGKPVVLNFWASWCTPCRKEMPEFQAVYDKYKGQGLQIYGINVGESEVTVNDFLRRVGTSFPVLIDKDEKAQTDYKILPLPATFFIDRNGTIRAVYQFQMSQAQMETEVVRLLGQ